MTLSEERLAEIGRFFGACWTAADYLPEGQETLLDKAHGYGLELLTTYDEQRAEIEQLRGEVSALIIDTGRAYEELRQGWPKLARDANQAAIEQWNRADAAEAEVERLWAKMEAVEALMPKWEAEIYELTRAKEFGIAEAFRSAQGDLRTALDSSADVRDD